MKFRIPRHTTTHCGKANRETLLVMNHPFAIYLHLFTLQLEWFINMDLLLVTDWLNKSEMLELSSIRPDNCLSC